MRPISLEFQAFGPYAGHEIINFEELSSKGLFLICGETGSGKTMMLDAMTYALYGKSSGHGRDDFMAMRCTNAEAATSTFVKFIFENNGDYYLFERRLEVKRIKLSASYNLMKKDTDGIWRTLLENPKDKELNAKAVELLGLEYDQFRQVIVLPQGQFERLLTSNSDEKEKILTSIFGEEKWQKIADKFFESCKERNDALKSKKEKIFNSLSEENCGSISDLCLLVQQKETEYNKIIEEFTSAGYENRLKSLQEEKALVNRFGDLHKAENRKAELESAKADRDSDEQTLILAKKAEKVRGFIDNLNNSIKVLSDRQTELETAIKNETVAKERAEKAASILKEHIAKKDDIEKKKEQKTLYASKEADYANIQASEQEYNKLLDAYNKADKALASVKKANEESAQKLQNVKAQYDVLSAEHKTMLDAYINGISGILAKDLTEGIPCPVCGSTSHPALAKSIDDSITKESVDIKAEEMNLKKQELDKCSEIQEKGNAEEKQLIDTVADAKSRMNTAKVSHEKLLKGLFEGIADLSALKAEISKIDNEISKYEEATSRLEAEERSTTASHVEAKAKIDTATAEVNTARTNKEKAEKELDKAIAENGFNSKDEVQANLLSGDKIEKIQKSISEYDAEVVSNKKSIKDISDELKGKKEPDKEEIDRLINETSAARDASIAEQSKVGAEKKRLSDKVAALEKEGKDIEKDIVESDNDLVFAKALRGDTGTGLQRYVLGIMFSSVVSAANKMLELVHDGRYRLFRSDDKARGTNKRGLELKVYDKYSDDQEGRFVNTLSGGEKFLVSLALSIGMSTVAQKSGIKIEALFIDEGFGSLDENSIVDAMNILNNIQEANGLVGIISHVQILQDRIPTKLVVSKSEGKSHIKQSIG